MRIKNPHSIMNSSSYNLSHNYFAVIAEGECVTNSCFILLKVVTGNAAVSQEFKVLISKCWGSKLSSEKVNTNVYYS